MSWEFLSIQAINMLLDAGASPTNDAVVIAVNSGNTSCLEALIARGYSLETHQPPSNKICIDTVKFPHENDVNDGLAFGSISHAEVYASDALLQIAFMHGHEEMVRFLL